MIILFLSILLLATGFSKEISFNWKGLQLKLKTAPTEVSSESGYCQLTVVKAKKVISKYKFERESAVGGGLNICSYSVPTEKNQYWFTRYYGDYNFPYVAIDSSGKKYVFQSMPTLYRIESQKFFLGIHQSEVEDVAEISFFDIQKNGQFHIFSNKVLDKYFNPSVDGHEAYQQGSTIYFKLIDSQKIFAIKISSRKMQLVKTIPQGATIMQRYLPSFQQLNAY